jgi:anti-sigma-K factor RskA
METGIHELTAGYALDALEPDERRAYEAHLSGCETCQEELASLSDVTEALAVAASGPVPRPELRERILGAAHAEPQVVVPFESRSRRSVPVLSAVAAVAAVIAVGLGVWATQLSGDLDEARSALDSQRELAVVLADPEARTVALEQGQGRLVVDPDGRAVLALRGLGPAPAGKTYEVWVMEAGVPTRAGLFAGRHDADLVRVEEAVDDGDVVAVTIEAAGGVDAPTTQPIVASEPV